MYTAGSVLIVLLAVAGYLASIPSPAQYWGFAPDVSPIQAAERSYSEDDYRFLGARVINNQLGEGEIVYEIFRCNDHPSGHSDPKSFANYAELEGIDAWNKAENIREYARVYNLALLDLFETNSDTRCSTYDIR